MYYIDIIIIVFVLYIIYMYTQRGSGDVTMVQSKIDGKMYLVRNLEDKQKAADTLANISRELQQFVQYLQQRHQQNNEAVNRLVSRFDPDQISEGDYDVRYTTYTLNKGEKIVFCLRSREQQEEIHQHNLILFVAIHELAHIMTESHGHTEEFKKNFKFLLNEAVSAGIYTPENFKENPQSYCGITVTDSPLHN